MAKKRLTVLMACLVLTGCESLRQALPWQNAALQPEPNAESSVATLEPAPPKPAPPPTTQDSAQLIGLDRAALETLLGPPDRERRAYPAQVLGYRNSHCSLEIYLYPEVDSDSLQALSYSVTDAKGQQADGAAAAACAERIRRQRNADN